MVRVLVDGYKEVRYFSAAEVRRSRLLKQLVESDSVIAVDSSDDDESDCDDEGEVLIGDHNDYECKKCKRGGQVICCESCPNVYHPRCLNPPIDPKNLPPGDWFCPSCVNTSQSRARILKETLAGRSPPKAMLAHLKKRGAAFIEDEDGDVQFRDAGNEKKRRRSGSDGGKRSGSKGSGNGKKVSGPKSTWKMTPTGTPPLKASRVLQEPTPVDLVKAKSIGSPDKSTPGTPPPEPVPAPGPSPKRAEGDSPVNTSGEVEHPKEDTKKRRVSATWSPVSRSGSPEPAVEPTEDVKHDTTDDDTPVERVVVTKSGRRVNVRSFKLEESVSESSDHDEGEAGSSASSSVDLNEDPDEVKQEGKESIFGGASAEDANQDGEVAGDAMKGKRLHVPVSGTIKFGFTIPAVMDLINHQPEAKSYPSYYEPKKRQWPIVVGSFELLDVGKVVPNGYPTFGTLKHIYPVGYKCIRRKQPSTKVAGETVTYVCETLESRGQLVFKLSNECDPEESYSAGSPSTVWSMVLTKAAVLNGKLPEKTPKYAPRSIKSNKPRVSQEDSKHMSKLQDEPRISLHNLNLPLVFRAPLSSSRFTLISIGGFDEESPHLNSENLYPVGYKISRLVRKELYTAEICKGPIFRVTKTDADPPESYEGTSMSQAWAAALRASRQAAKATCSGPMLYGFDSPCIQRLLKSLAQSREEEPVGQPSSAQQNGAAS